MWAGYGWEPCLGCTARAFQRQQEQAEHERIEAAQATECRRHIFRVLTAHGAIWVCLIYFANTADRNLLGAIAFGYPMVFSFIVHRIYRKFILGKDEWQPTHRGTTLN
jgi:hypothetical protein